MSSAAAAAAAGVKFVGSDADGLPLKRRQVQQACLSCRKKKRPKKRCIHTYSSPPSEPKVIPAPQPPDASLDTSPLRGPDTTTSLDGFEEDICQVAATQLVELSSRFVGDLNPESIFIEATTRKETSAPPAPDEIGIWTSARPDSVHDHIRSRPTSRHYRGRTERPGSLLAAFESARARYLRDECLVTIPPPSEYAALHQIFMDKVYPIFPIFTSSDLAGTSPDGVYSDVLKQVIALIGGLDPAGRRHLRLELGGQLLKPQKFHQQLAEAIFPVLEADWIQSKVDHIRILTTMALFYQPFDSSQRDRGRAAWLNAQAVHHLQTLCAHLKGYRPQRPDEDIDRVFCAVWAVDRLCASFYARPTVIHERDVEKDLESAINKQPPCFQLLLRLVQTLDNVFPLYRPNNQRFVYTDIPVLESLIMDTGTGRTPTRLLATLEILYHAISVLSCRQPRSAFSLTSPEDNRSHLPNSAINPRRSLSADRIVWVVQNEDLGPFPFVPYAVSLALSVEYRKMRYSKTVMFRNRGRGMFRNIVTELGKLGEYFFSARVNAGLGESILREMEKTASTLRDEMENGSGAVAISTSAARLPRNGTPIASVPRDLAASTDIRMTDAPLLATKNGGGSATLAQNGYHMGPLTSASSIQAPEMDSSAFDHLDVDVDLFGFFDPSFDLGAVDTALEANLNMGVPQVWPAEAWSFGV